MFERQPEVVERPLEDILADRFSRYSKYIIQERALPDARDGLKPVQRRILWAMLEDGNTFNHPYRKSAKTVGNVIGNYHPHGDTSVYDALVRLSQDWKIRWPLIDMQETMVQLMMILQLPCAIPKPDYREFPIF